MSADGAAPRRGLEPNGVGDNWAAAWFQDPPSLSERLVVERARGAPRSLRTCRWTTAHLAMIRENLPTLDALSTPFVRMAEP
jgi:hypothetical protein